MVRLFPLSLVAGCDFEHNMLIDEYSCSDFNAEMVLKIADIAPIRIIAQEISDESFKFVVNTQRLKVLQELKFLLLTKSRNYAPLLVTVKLVLLLI